MALSERPIDPLAAGEMSEVLWRSWIASMGSINRKRTVGPPGGKPSGPPVFVDELISVKPWTPKSGAAAPPRS
jgi:hypothetical protein